MMSSGYTTIPDWMLELDLDAHETIILAVIYGFSQDGESTYKGTQKYLAGKAKCSMRKVANALGSLVEKKLIEKIDIDIRGIHLCEYKVTNMCIMCKGVAPHAGGIAPRASNNIEDNININSESNKGRPKFQKPTIPEIAAYCMERGNNIDPEEFFNFYESKGWVIGKSPMKDWKACIRTWERNKRTPFAPRQAAPQRKKSAFEHNLEVADQMFGTNLSQIYEENLQ